MKRASLASDAFVLALRSPDEAFVSELDGGTVVEAEALAVASVGKTDVTRVTRGDCVVFGLVVLVGETESVVRTFEAFVCAVGAESGSDTAPATGVEGGVEMRKGDGVATDAAAREMRESV